MIDLFKHYLRTKKLSDASIYKYSVEVPRFIKEYYKIDIYEITILNEYDKLETITADSYFSKINTDGHGMYLAGIRHYKKFLNSISYKIKDDVIPSSIVNIGDIQQHYEGEIIERIFLSRTRNTTIVKKVKERDRYTCCACSFYYNDKVVEVHHIVPINKKTQGLVSEEDLITLCPNCHNIAHVLLKENDLLYSDKDILLEKLKKRQTLK